MDNHSIYDKPIERIKVPDEFIAYITGFIKSPVIKKDKKKDKQQGNLQEKVFLDTKKYVEDKYPNAKWNEDQSKWVIGTGINCECKEDNTYIHYNKEDKHSYYRCYGADCLIKKDIYGYSWDRIKNWIRNEDVGFSIPRI